MYAKPDILCDDIDVNVHSRGGLERHSACSVPRVNRAAGMGPEPAKSSLDTTSKFSKLIED